MEYRIRETGAVVQSHELHAMHPNVSGIRPETCVDFGADPVYPSEPPVPGLHQKLVRDGAELVDGIWRARYALVQMSESEASQVNESMKNRIMGQVQSRLDQVAQERGYDSMLSLCSYATSTVPRFAAEGQYGVDLRDQTWAALVQIYAAVASGARAVPSWDDIEAELPAVVWPTVSEG
ncbi:hypothetical protein B9Z51_08625 [Limnohabitans sp. T6-5]|uniref:hypothetical protein n=1 Tax=Limnohabitans sp. T6-5 TaxID=1100724 RepID=UPI000D3BB0F9|nr:hypothetical protein [Limnohabitans sp. T6-5]PUE08988.1 hypothetical protein B9Z51_08625 [Limnohabitans sp. T6-5]